MVVNCGMRCVMMCDVCDVGACACACVTVRALCVGDAW